MRGRLVFFVAVVAMVFFSAQGIAATIYVDQSNASGVEDGSVDNPYNTIMEGINNAANGDTVRVAAGTYNENVVISGLQVRLIGESPVNTIIQAAGNVIDISGIYSDGSENVEVANFTVTGGTGNGIYLDSTTVYGLIHNNIIIGNVNGVHAKASDATVSNNTIANNSGIGIYAYASNATISASNNIIVQNGTYGIRTAGNYHPEIISAYNNCWSNTSGDFSRNSGTLTQIGDVSLDPQFLNNYQLMASSLSIDAGRPIAADNDPDGTRNNQGAYGGPGAAAFWPEPAGGPVVTTLSVTPASVPVGGTLRLQATGEIK